MQMIKCQSCGTQNLESSQYCDECGDSLNKYKAPEAPVEEVIQPNSNQSASQEIPVFQSASVTSIGVPSVVEEETPDLIEKEVEEGKEELAVKHASLKPKGLHSSLIIERGAAIGTEFPLSSEESNIGRWDADNGVFPDVDLDAFDPEAKVSRKHARILFKNGVYMVEDLGSTNGTFVNRGRRLIPGNPHRLDDGDEIIVGKTFLRFRLEK